MARLIIDMTYNDHFREIEVACVLIKFVAKITSWGNIPVDRSIELLDSKGAFVGSARLETS